MRRLEDVVGIHSLGNSLAIDAAMLVTLVVQFHVYFTFDAVRPCGYLPRNFRLYYFLPTPEPLRFPVRTLSKIAICG